MLGSKDGFTTDCKTSRLDYNYNRRVVMFNDIFCTVENRGFVLHSVFLSAIVAIMTADHSTGV